LIREFIKWPSDLPNPETYSPEDAFFVERANAIYLAAVDFILCHELAHVACGHFEKLKQARRRKGQITPRETKKLEREADKWALHQVVRGIRPPERSLTAVGFGAVVGLASLLFLNRNLTRPNHPDIDARIRHVLSGLSIDDPDNLWGVAVTFYVAWDKLFSVGIDFARKYKTYGALVRAIERQLKLRKQRPRKREEHVLGLD
jgi:hypothetical protein